MKDYDVYVDIVGTIVYRVSANSQEEALDQISQGNYDDMDLHSWDESGEPEVIEVE